MLKGRDKPSISVIVPTYNRCKDLKRCLDSLLLQTLKNFEIIVIDNGSTDGTPTLLREYPVKIITDFTKNLAHLFNLGWHEASASIVAYINDDAEAVSDWLENIVKNFNEFEDASIIGGPTVATHKQEIQATYEMAYRSKLLNTFAKIYNVVILEGKLYDIGVLCESGAYSIGASLLKSTLLERPIYVDMLSITGMAVKKEVIRKLGGFDENFLFNHIDGDFFIRARRLGCKLVFNPKATVWHHVNPRGPVRGAHYMGKDFAYFYLKDIRPKTMSGWLRFALNIFIFNVYWIYKAFQLREVTPFKGITGFLSCILSHRTCGSAK